MLIVLAHAGDAIARRLAAAWSPNARVISPRDLSASPWRHYPAGGGGDTIGLPGRPVPVADLTGVLVRLAAVSTADLAHIAEEDRGYVACEMTAFLLSLLSSLPCVVVNRPAGSSLMGPGWSAERWRAAAVAAGFDAAAGETGRLVTVIGDDCFGAAAPPVADRAVRLARLAQIEFLPLRVTADGRFASVDPWAEPPPPAAAALRALLAAARECPR